MQEQPIGHRLKLLRIGCGMTMREAAKQSGLATNTVLYIEQGTHRPHDLTVGKLARAYGVPIGDLIDPAPAKQPAHAGVEVA